MNNTSYSYKLNIGLALAVLLLFGGSTFFFAYIAMHNDVGLVINRLIHLSPTAATILYSLLSILSSLLVVGIVLVIIQSIGKKRFVLLTHESITAPKKGISYQLTTIPYHEIIAVQVDKISGTRFLRISSHHQKLVIPNSMLSKKDFDELINDLSKRIEFTKQEADKC
jgi:hypothetical protein